jgi:hypothetical protein
VEVGDAGQSGDARDLDHLGVGVDLVNLAGIVTRCAGMISE